MEFLKKSNAVSEQENKNVVDIVSDIIDNIKNNGDKSLKEYEQKFGNSTRATFKLSDEEIKTQIEKLDEETKALIDQVVTRVKNFAEAQMNSMKPIDQDFGDGIRMGHRIIPIEKVGAYVPGGRYPLLSSGVMVVAPAKVAGAKKIIACSPAAFEGSIHPATVYGLVQSGVDEIYAVGGAQAIASMAYGTETIPEVDIITGPGNKFVAEAKKQVFGKVGIDMLAGPSEVVMLADGNSSPKLCASDLLAQAEHDPNARAILITTSKENAEQTLHEISEQFKAFKQDSPVFESWDKHGEIIIAENEAELIQVSDEIAGEHIHVHCQNYEEIGNQLNNFGSLFLGENSSVVFSDKVSGTNHTLPTNKASRFTGGLWVGTYLKVATFQEISGEGIDLLANHSVQQSNIEGLHGHKMSAFNRL